MSVKYLSHLSHLSHLSPTVEDCMLKPHPQPLSIREGR